MERTGRGSMVPISLSLRAKEHTDRHVCSGSHVSLCLWVSLFLHVHMRNYNRKGSQRELRVVISSPQVSNEGEKGEKGKRKRKREGQTLVETRQMRILNAGGA
jgi:hypothetical protein